MSDGCGATLDCTPACTGKCTGDTCDPYDLTDRSVCSTTGWCFRDNLPQPYNIKDAWAISSTDVYAVGDAGTIIHYDGRNWSGIAGLRTGTFRSVWASSATDVWVVGDGGIALRGSASAGWTPVTLPVGTSSLLRVRGSSATSVSIVGSGNVFLVWDGSGFTSPTLPTGLSYLTSVWERSPSSRWISGSSGTFYWDGATWTKETATGLIGMWGTGTELLGVSSYAVLRRIGTTWATLASPRTSWSTEYFNIAGLSDTAVYAVGSYAGSGGTTAPARSVVDRWTGSSLVEAQSLATPNLIAAVAAAPGLDFTALGTAGYVGTGRSGTWTTQSVDGVPRLVSQISGRSATDLWVADARGVAHWKGDGWDAYASASYYTPKAVWAEGASSALFSSQMPSGVTGIFRVTTTTSPVLELSGDILAIWGSSATDVWAGGTGLLQRKIGSTWATISHPLSGTTARILSISGVSSTDVWAVGDLGYTLHWEGTSWTLVSSGVSTSIAGVWAAASNDVWAISGGAVLHWDGTSWSTAQSFSGVTLESVGGAGLDVWVAGSGKLYRRVGTTFTQVDLALPTNSVRGIYADGVKKKVFVGHGGAGYDGNVLENAY